MVLRSATAAIVRVNRAWREGGVESALAPLRSVLKESLKPIPWLPGAFIVQAGVFAQAQELDGGDVAAPTSGAGGERAYTLEQSVQDALIRGFKSGELAQQELTSMVPAQLLSLRRGTGATCPPAQDDPAARHAGRRRRQPRRERARRAAKYRLSAAAPAVRANDRHVLRGAEVPGAADARG